MTTPNPGTSAIETFLSLLSGRGLGFVNVEDEDDDDDDEEDEEEREEEEEEVEEDEGGRFPGDD